MKNQPIYFEVRGLIDPATGKKVGALVPKSQTDLDLMKERALTVGSVVRATVTRQRNEKFHRLAHCLGRLISEQIDEYVGKSPHDALKSMQLAGGIMCDTTITPIDGVGELVTRKARSIAFDAMDEGEFREFMRLMCQHIVEKHWPTMTVEQIEEMAEMMG